MKTLMWWVIVGSLIFGLVWWGTSQEVWEAGEVHGDSVEQSFSDLDE